MPHKLGEPKSWKGPAPIPDPELRARPTGTIQWSCPNCGNLHGYERGFWKRAMIQCKRKDCQRKYRVGIGFTEHEGSLICLFYGPWQLNTANRLEPHSGWDMSHPIGRLYGPLDWECPNCSKVNASNIKFKAPHVKCDCGKLYFVQLLIYKPQGSRNITPFDWAVFNVPETDTSTPLETVGEGQ